MRPVRLVAEGFTAFRDRTEIDFTGADFFVLVGPTGSGKSSVLDAICFALYGSVPRYDDDRVVAPAITQGANQALVSLAFDVGGSEYVATRVVRRTKNGATTKEARLERGDRVLAGDARAMNVAVAELIGLPFRHFTQCVVLPQGEFAEFMHDKPSERQELLVKLLDLGVYARMMRAANALAAEAENAIKLDEQRLRDLANCTPGAEAEAKAAVAELGKLRTTLQKGEVEVRAMEAAAEGAEKEAAAAREVVRHLEAVKVPAAVKTLGAHLEEAVAERERASKARDAADKELARHDEELATLPDPAPLQLQIEAYQELEQVATRVAELEAARRDAVPTLDAAHAALETATHARQHAEADYDAAVEDTAATRLAAGLKIGEPCPVCDQIVTEKPKVRVGEKDRASKARDAARKKERAAKEKLDTLTKHVAEITAESKAQKQRQSTLQRKVTGAPPPDALVKQIAEIRAARARQQELSEAVRQAAQAERAAVEAVEAVDRSLADARARCEQQRDPLVRAGLDVPGIGADLVTGWTELASWATSAVDAHRNTATEQAKRAEQQAAAARNALDHLVELCEAAGVAVPKRPAPTIGALRELAAAEEQAASAEVKRIVAGMKDSAAIMQRVANAREQVEVAKELARLLRSDRFEQWIVNEALRFLVEGASVTLEQLSGGQYALSVADDNEFEVVDHRNADERRSVKTLSGGETFQASLALALALADHVGTLVAGGAAKLDAIFLDEGFGTLDADTLDTVAATLETLGHDGRMVGIVTHVRDLAERVPVRYEVAKGPRTSTVTRVDA
jgi:exonuclease SbcC